MLLSPVVGGLFYSQLYRIPELLLFREACYAFKMFTAFISSYMFICGLTSYTKNAAVHPIRVVISACVSHLNLATWMDVYLSSF